jgi:hypothetical protein
MPRTERDRELAKRRHRKTKIEKLVARYVHTVNQADKQIIAAKVRRLSPLYNIEARIAELTERGQLPPPPRKATPKKA